MYCLVVTDDYSRFTWIFFLATKDETSGILKSFITGIDNLVDHKVKVIRYDNGTEFKNREMNQFYEIKGILRQYSVARTPQQNIVARRRNRTLIEAARTMIVDSKLPTTFWAEAVNIACYVHNRVLVVKPHNKTPYELFHGRTSTLSFMRPFGCPVTILNTIDHLRKFDGKDDEVSLFSENTPNVVGSGPDWLFDIDALTRTMNYEPIVADYILLPLWTADPPFSQNPKSSDDDEFKPSSDVEKKVNEDPRKESECNDQEKEDNVNSTNNVNIVSLTVNAAGTNKDNAELPVDPNMLALEDLLILIIYNVMIQKMCRDDMNQFRYNNTKEPKMVIHALKDPSWIEAMHEELLTFSYKKSLGTLVDLPNGKRAIGTKWVFRNKKDKKGIVIRNKARLVAQRYTQEEGVGYDEVFAPIARIEAIRLFLAYASFNDFMAYQMDVKSAFLYGKIEEEVYVCQPPGFEDPEFPDRVYKVEKALYRLHQAPRAWNETLSIYLLDNGRRRMAYLLVKINMLVKFKEVWFKEVRCSTPMETQKLLLKDEDGEEVDVHMYRYLKGQPKLGLWYPKDSPFDLVAYTDSDYAGASLDRKSTTGGCQFLGSRLISWQCKKQTVDANSITEAEYVAVLSCYGQVLWIQNQLLDY
ncbi:retrovirus-related pol polyprotein from transposon TNT 1-94, partial [Tanacetum coccineum]